MENNSNVTTTIIETINTIIIVLPNFVIVVKNVSKNGDLNEIIIS